ncbi:MAG: hypothetical protein ACOYM0_01080 [Bacteroidales bacterium]
MKTKIIDFFKTDRTYRGGVSLVHQFSVKLGLKKQLNIHPESDYLKGCVYEELREIAGISSSELNTYLAMPLPKALPLKRSHDLSARLNANVDPPKAEQHLEFEKKQQTAVASNKKKAAPVKKQSRKK